MLGGLGVKVDFSDHARRVLPLPEPVRLAGHLDGAYHRFALDKVGFIDQFEGLAADTAHTIEGGTSTAVLATVSLHVSYAVQPRLIPYVTIGLGHVWYTTDDATLTTRDAVTNITGQTEHETVTVIGIGLEVPLGSSFSFFGELNSVIGRADDQGGNILISDYQFVPLKAGFWIRF